MILSGGAGRCMDSDDPRHGTVAGYLAERRAVRGGKLRESCGECLMAWRQYHAARYRALANRRADGYTSPHITTSGESRWT